MPIRYKRTPPHNIHRVVDCGLSGTRTDEKLVLLCKCYGYFSSEAEWIKPTNVTFHTLFRGLHVGKEDLPPTTVDTA